MQADRRARADLRTRMGGMTEKLTYTISMEDGHWLARTPGVAGSLVGKSLSELKREVVKATGFFWPGEDVTIDYSYRLPERFTLLLEAYRHAKELAENYGRQAQEAARALAEGLTGEVSERDAAELMGIS